MFVSLSLPMKAERSLNKERLEASLACLCELELLKQRQEARVFSALRLQDSARPCRPLWAALRAARCAQVAENGDALDQQQVPLAAMTASLEQQVSELRVQTETEAAARTAGLRDPQPGPGEFSVDRNNNSPEVNSNRSAVLGPGSGGTANKNPSQADSSTSIDTVVEMRLVYPSQEDFQQALKVEMYIFGLIQRQAGAVRRLKPRTSFAHDAPAVTGGRQSGFCCEEELPSPKQVPARYITPALQCSHSTPPQVCQKPDHDLNSGTSFSDGPPPPYIHRLPEQSVQDQPCLLPRPRQASASDTLHSTLQDCASFRVLQAHPDSSKSEPDSPQYFYHYPPGSSTLHQLSVPEEQLVNAHYIPAQPCRAFKRAQNHGSTSHKGSGIHRHNCSAYSPERGNHHQDQQSEASQVQASKPRCHGGPKKCRLNEERSGAIKKPGRKACRSQSENSLQRVQERNYSTVERDGGGSGSGGRGSHSRQSRTKKQSQGDENYWCWQSNLEISQYEADAPVQAPWQGSTDPNQRNHCEKRTRKSRSAQPPYTNQPQYHSLYHRNMEYLVERDRVPQCPQPGMDFPYQGPAESESSTSEADSPDSSSLSSDSDESGGLVWPQQLPPQLTLPSPSVTAEATLQPKAFVKIKASHALKKKILRFRTGSLKLMTTV